MKKSVRVLGIIPARGGSKRIPGKNLARVGGKPLIAHAIRAAQDSAVLDACIVSTDNARIAVVAKALGADVPFLRPKNFARDASRDIEYAQHALRWLADHRGWQPEIVVFLPPDVPQRTGKDIDRVVTFLLKEKLDSVRTIAGPIGHPSCKAMWTKRDAKRHLIAPLFPEYVGRPAQEVPPYYLSVGLVYATRAEFIRKGTLWGPRVGGFVVDPARALEIDEPEQLRQAQLAFRKRKKL